MGLAAGTRTGGKRKVPRRLGLCRLARLLGSWALALVLSSGAWPVDPRLSTSLNSLFPESDSAPRRELAQGWSGPGGAMPALCQEAHSGAPICTRPIPVARCLVAATISPRQPSALSSAPLRQSVCRRFHRPVHYPLRIGGADAEDADPLST
jgi:hypothetical protein